MENLQSRIIPIEKIFDTVQSIYNKTGHVPKITILADTLYEVEEINRDILSIENDLKATGILINRFHVFNIIAIWSSNKSRNLLLSAIEEMHIKDVDPAAEQNNSINLTIKLLSKYENVITISEDDIKMYP